MKTLLLVKQKRPNKLKRRKLVRSSLFFRLSGHGLTTPKVIAKPKMDNYFPDTTEMNWQVFNLSIL
jgi:hypothetical protein